MNYEMELETKYPEAYGWLMEFLFDNSSKYQYMIHNSKRIYKVGDKESKDKYMEIRDNSGGYREFEKKIEIEGEKYIIGFNYE